jgi:hypothetical protein
LKKVMFGWVKFKFLQIVDLNCSIRLCFFFVGPTPSGV